MLLDYLEHLDYLVRLDLFYECAVGVVCFAVADDEKLTVDEALADIGVASSDILYSRWSWVVVNFHRNIV